MIEPLHKIEEVNKRTRLVVFDLDGTLTESKSDMDFEMAELVKRLIEKRMTAIISGGRFERFQKQFFDKLTALHGNRVKLGNLFIFPTSGSIFYRYINGNWQEVYSDKLSDDQKKRVFEAFEKTFQKLNYVHPEKTFGELIEDRNTQITFSALGQEAPWPLKEKWREEHPEDKLKIVQMMRKYLPDLEVRMGGYTSVDITRKGIDKEYGIRQMKKHLGIDFDEMLFVGDALFPGGNDSTVLNTGVPCFEVKGPDETKELIRALL